MCNKGGMEELWIPERQLQLQDHFASRGSRVTYILYDASDKTHTLYARVTSTSCDLQHIVKPSTTRYKYRAFSFSIHSCTNTHTAIYIMLHAILSNSRKLDVAHSYKRTSDALFHLFSQLGATCANANTQLNEINKYTIYARTLQHLHTHTHTHSQQGV